MPGKHALLSASGASRWMECPPSARLEENFPESTTTYADEGTFAHSLSELIIRRHLGWISEKKYGELIAGYHLNQYYSHEMLDHCEGYAAFVMEKFNQEPGSRIFLEKRLDMSKYIKEGFGTGDVVIHRPVSRAVLGIDLKYGKGVPVSAIENKQGKLYLLGMLDALDFVYDIDDCTFIIYQPRLDSTSEYDISVKALEQWGETVLRPAAELAYDGKGEYNPGDHCRFCRAKATCKALAEFNLAALRYKFAEDEKADLINEALLNDKDVSEILKKSDLFIEWIKSVTAHALDQAVKHNKKWPGFKLVEGRSNRYFKSVETVEFTLAENDFTEDQIYNKKLKSFEDLTKLMGKLKFESLLTPLLIKPPGAPTLAPIEDKRPELNNIDKVKARFDESE